mmetsp:Transcript_10332/g.12530  ORF Transcript_10332/g.12530 Transcript_10332/m.12530 type:complete len:84 (+) Transcript_10332:370-621(+)
MIIRKKTILEAIDTFKDLCTKEAPTDEIEYHTFKANLDKATYVTEDIITQTIKLLIKSSGTGSLFCSHGSRTPVDSVSKSKLY